MPGNLVGNASSAAIVQNVIADADNSSAANIAIGGNFTGAWESTLGVNSIQVSVIAGQQCTVYVEQDSNPLAVTAKISDLVIYVPGKPFGITVQATDTYWRIRVVNNGTAIATGVVISSVLCPIADPLPRALDEWGNLKAGIKSITDLAGHKVHANFPGDLNTNQAYRLVGTTFGVAGAVDPTFWTATGTGSGGETHTILLAGILSLVCGTTNPAYSQVTSFRQARYIHGMTPRLYMRTRLTALSVAGSVRKWGMYNVSAAPPAVQDGFVFSVDAANLLTLSCYNAGAIPAGLTVSSGAFNGDVSQVILDTNTHKWEVYASLGKIEVWMDTILLHTFVTTTAMASSTYNLGVAAACSGTGTSATLEVWAGTIHRLGREHNSPIWKHYAGAVANVNIKSGPGILRKLIVNASNNTTVISLFDSLTNTNAIAIWTVPANNLPPYAIDFDLEFYTGLSITGVGAANDITVVYE